MHQLLHITLLPRERMCPCMRPYECIMRVFICCPYGYLRLFPSSITWRAKWSPMNHVLGFVYVCVCVRRQSETASICVCNSSCSNTHRAGGECAESDCTHARTETCVALSTTVLHQRLRLERAQVWGHQFTALIHCKGPIPNHGDEAQDTSPHHRRPTLCSARVTASSPLLPVNRKSWTARLAVKCESSDFPLKCAYHGQTIS